MKCHWEHLKCLVLVVVVLHYIIGMGNCGDIIQEEETSVPETAIGCSTFRDIDICLSKLLPFSTERMPINLEEIKKTCNEFNGLMDCVNTWSKQCINNKGREMFNTTTIGAFEYYRFLCTDPTFRNDFLRYGSCYPNMSPHWNDCSRLFITALQKVDYSNDNLILCCIRYRYLRCVKTVANHFCPRGVDFLMKIAHALILTKRDQLDPPECRNATRANCAFSKIFGSVAAAISSAGQDYSRFLKIIMTTAIATYYVTTYN